MFNGGHRLSASDGAVAAESADAQADPEAVATTTRPRLRRRIVETVVVLLAAAVIAVSVRTFAVETFFIPSGSMTPSLLTGDRILVDKLPWVRDDIHRGDIVVFKRVPKDPETEDADLVKRVIGLPGETISSKGDTIYIDGKPLRQSWLPSPAGVYSQPDNQKCAESAYNIPTTHIPAGQYFVMGDCRAISYDSRYWGTVPASYIIGKVDLVIWRNGHPWFHWF